MNQPPLHRRRWLQLCAAASLAPHASAFAQASAKDTERPLVVAVRKPGAEVDSESLREFLRPKLARFQLPDDFEWVDALPKTSTGKFLKTKLRDMFRDRASQTPG